MLAVHPVCLQAWLVPRVLCVGTVLQVCLYHYRQSRRGMQQA